MPSSSSRLSTRNMSLLSSSSSSKWNHRRPHLYGLWSSSSLLWFLLISFSSTSTMIQAQPVIHSTVQCSSDLLDGGFYTPLTDRLSMHWLLKPDTKEFSAVVEYLGTGWVGLGFSATGTMIDSQAVIGSEAGVHLYDLTARMSTGVVLDSGDSAAAKSLKGDLTETTSKEMDPQSNLVFTMDLSEAAFQPDADGLYRMIVAAGESNVLDYHKHRAAFQIDLLTCAGSGTTASTTGETGTSSTTAAAASAPLGDGQPDYYDHKTAFATHGFFATLSFAIIIPFAVAAAWFRNLMPKWWIYIHVLSNCLAFFFTMLAVAVAFGGMVMRGKKQTDLPPPSRSSDHMSRAHHWVGLILFFVVIFQVINGFRRPPVEAKLDVMGGGAGGAGGSQDGQHLKAGCCGQRTARENWHLTHRLVAIMSLCMAVFQVQSGLKLFALEYNHTTESKSLKIFWVWFTVLAIVFLAMKIYLCGRERRKHKSNQILSRANIMPQREEDDGDGPNGNGGAGQNYSDSPNSREFANVI